VTKSYLGPFNEAMKRLLENDNDVEKANLAKEQFVVVLTLGFNSFTRFGSKKLDDLRGDVKVEIAKHYEGGGCAIFLAKATAEASRSCQQKADSPPVDGDSQPAHKRPS